MRIPKWFKSNFQNIYNLIILLVSILAVILSFQQIKLSKTQFEENSKSSEILFKAQNEELKKLQLITSNQIEITKNQLKETIYQSRPKISLLSFFSNYIYETDYNETRLKTGNYIEIENVGGRSARKIEIVLISFLNDYTINSKKEKFIIIDNLNPGEKIKKEYIFKISKTLKDYYYVYFKLIYHDIGLQDTFEQDYYYKFSELPSDISETCSSLEIENIKKVLDN